MKKYMIDLIFGFIGLIIAILLFQYYGWKATIPISIFCIASFIHAYKTFPN